MREKSIRERCLKKWDGNLSRLRIKVNNWGRGIISFIIKITIMRKKWNIFSNSVLNYKLTLKMPPGNQRFCIMSRIDWASYSVKKIGRFLVKRSWLSSYSQKILIIMLMNSIWSIKRLNSLVRKKIYKVKLQS